MLVFRCNHDGSFSKLQHWALCVRLVLPQNLLPAERWGWPAVLAIITLPAPSRS